MSRDKLRWYHFRRSYRMTDDVYVLAPRAVEATELHWESYGGIGYAFDQDAPVWATEPDLIPDGNVRTSRVRRTTVDEVPAWMVKQALILRAQPKTPEIEAAVKAWDYGEVKTHEAQIEDAPLRVFMA